MINHLVTMDKDDFETLCTLLGTLRHLTGQLDASFTKNELNRKLGEVEDILGIEPPKIPEAVTAKWDVIIDPIEHVRRCRCSNCRNIIVQSIRDPITDLPTTCRTCKAVMVSIDQL